MGHQGIIGRAAAGRIASRACNSPRGGQLDIAAGIGRVRGSIGDNVERNAVNGQEVVQRTGAEIGFRIQEGCVHIGAIRRDIGIRGDVRRGPPLDGRAGRSRR